MQDGDRVKIKAGPGGMSDFFGKTGRIIRYREYRDGRTWLHRVQLEVPVSIPGVGIVSDDLWSSEHLTKIK